MDKDDELFVYVDGDEIYDGEDDDEEEDGDGGIASEVAELFKPHRISHIYVGGGSAAAGTKTSHHVTVSSVLLYNEALTGEEIRKLAESKVALGGPAAGNAGGELQAAPPVSTSEGGEAVPEVKPEDARGEQQTEDGGGTEGLQEKKDGAAGEAPVREERSPAELGSGAANASPQQPVNALPHATGTPKVEGEGSQKAEAGSAGDPAPREEDAGVPDPGAAPQSSGVEVASEPTGDSLLSSPEEKHQQEEEKDLRPQLSPEADREAGDASTPSNVTRNSDAEEAEEAEDVKEKKELEEEATEVSGGALASPPTAAPAAAGAPRPGATEQAVGAETSERQRGPLPPADGAGTTVPAGDGQARQGAPSHAPEAVGGVPSASAAPTDETPNAAANENGAGPQTAADADGGHEAPSNAATTPTAQAPGQPGTTPTRDAAPHVSNSSTTFKNITGPYPMNTESDGAVRGCVTWLLLLTLLALCGVAAGF
ncbi:trans-sialidase [Trypanosoma conorhini]|uniref:Trans-sialidase n=1 Tax=Trypanosoma conorhini TaxID=83891 RepID=A0A422MSX0_9TRYP|nr:trans-sialidase [Trypanosoma conorhini]RNE96318.1 trans-sialidase [Trypanosoma conorhini]